LIALFQSQISLFFAAGWQSTQAMSFSTRSTPRRRAPRLMLRRGGGRCSVRRAVIGSALAASLLCAASAGAQDVTEPALKAAFIYNFAKFTDWPADAVPATAQFNACVLGDPALGDALERAMVGRHLAGRQIGVSRVRLGAAMRSCHLLYISGLTWTQIEALTASLRGAPILTISDLDDFTRVGVVQMFVESGKMRFNFNLDVARQARLQLSSKLLVLAAHVRGGPGAEVR
jgi:YfiR/HmsC-like